MASRFLLVLDKLVDGLGEREPTQLFVELKVLLVELESAELTGGRGRSEVAPGRERPEVVLSAWRI